MKKSRHYKHLSKVSSQHMDHLGLVSGCCKQLKISKTIDSIVGPKAPDCHVSTGDCVVAMIIHQLSFSNFTLHSTSQFFSNKPIELLLGANIKSEWLNDDRLGRVLDKLYEIGVTEVFMKIASMAAKQLDLERKMLGIDSTSFSVYGTKYHKTENLQNTLVVTRGFSKDNKPHLLQLCLNLITSHKDGFPLLMVPGDGNQSDRTKFAEILEKFSDQLTLAEENYCYVADSAFYNKKSLKKVSAQLKWLSRPPKNIKFILELIEQLSDKEFKQFYLCSEKNGLSKYSGIEVCGVYAGIKQRFFIVINHTKAAAVQKNIESKWKKLSMQAYEKHRRLSNKRFHCRGDAKEAIKKDCFVGEYSIEKYEGSATTGKKDPKNPNACYYKIEITTASDMTEKLKMERKSTRFVIATNELDSSKLSSVEMLKHYKGQNRVEQGFRLLKDPLFMSNILFLKKPRRIMALLLIMTISLLVYAALESEIRKKLELRGKTIPNQLNKEVSDPTVRWVFICFQGIDIQYPRNNSPPKVANLLDIHFLIIHLLGEEYECCYLIHE